MQLRLMARTLNLLRQSVGALESYTPASMGSIASYLLAEHNCVADVGALPILWEIEDALLVPRPAIYIVHVPEYVQTILGNITRAVGRGRGTPRGPVTQHAVGNFILQENLPVLIRAPELFPGLRLVRRTDLGARSAIDRRPKVSIYERIYRAYVRRCIAHPGPNGTSSEQAARDRIYAAFDSVGPIALAGLPGLPRWRWFEAHTHPMARVVQLVREVQVPFDFAFNLEAAARDHAIMTRMASFLLVQDLAAPLTRVTPGGYLADTLEQALEGRGE
uniref:Uncharacterized protein n=1 Tax=viral metagenome TaxID=1070528 RepID=A0A6M3LA41_9ZZZZ